MTPAHRLFYVVNDLLKFSFGNIVSCVLLFILIFYIFMQFETMLFVEEKNSEDFIYLRILFYFAVYIYIAFLHCNIKMFLKIFNNNKQFVSDEFCEPKERKPKERNSRYECGK